MVKYMLTISGNSYVWHENINVIKQFMLQHNYTDAYLNNIETSESISTVDAYKNTNYRLQPFFFGSNVNPEETYTVFTTKNLMDEIYDYLYCELEEKCYMNDLIAMTDIPIIKAINELIYKLPYVFVLNHVHDEGMDEYSEEVFVSNLNYVKLFDSTQRENGYGSKPTESQLVYLSYANFQEYIKEALIESMQDSYQEKIKQPISIEGYVAMFLKVIKSWEV